MSDSTKAALLLDELLRRDDLPELVPSLRALLPRSARDQLDAATAQVARAGTAHIAAADAPDWLLLALLSGLTAWVAGEWQTCPHVAWPIQPQPVVTTAWTPGRVACLACSPQLMPEDGSEADRTCDRCGRVTAGVLGSDPIWMSFVALGPFMFLFGVCASCFGDLPPDFQRPRTTATR